MRWQKTLTLTVVAALAGVASAAVTETWDGGEWSNGQLVDGSNGWAYDLGGDATTRVEDGIGYLGSRGAQSGSGASSIHVKSLDATISAGTYVAKALLNVASGSRADAVIGVFFDGDNFARVDVYNDWKTTIVMKEGGTQSEVTASDSGLGGLGWLEMQVIYDADFDNVSGRYRDVTETMPAAYIGDWVDLPAFPANATFDVTKIVIGAGNASNPGGPSGIIDNIGQSIPEPASLALLALGGLMFLRRRHAA